MRVPPPKSKAFKTKVASAGGGGEGRGNGGIGPAAVGRSGIGFAAVVQLESDVVPDHAGGDIAGGHGEGDGVLAGLQQGGVELLDVLVPDALVGVVVQRVGRDAVTWTCRNLSKPSEGV